MHEINVNTQLKNTGEHRRHRGESPKNAKEPHNLKLPTHINWPPYKEIITK